MPPFIFSLEANDISKPKATIPPSVEIDADGDGDGPQRWTAKSKAALIIDILQGKATAAEAARQHALTLAEVEQWSSNVVRQPASGCP